MQLQEKIQRFWKWFQENEHQFRDVTNVQEAVESMDNQILEFGLFAWEIGEGAYKPYSLIISPNSDWNRMQISEQIVRSAPNLREWEFHFCKPPKSWNYTFEMYDRFLSKQLFDASEWEFVLEKNEDDLVEVIICANNLDELEEDDRLNAGEMALINILGEESFIRFVGALEMVADFEPKYLHQQKKLPALKNTFSMITSEW